MQKTYDSNVLTFKGSNGYWEESTYDSNNNQLTYKDYDGFSWEKTYDPNGNELTFKDSTGYSWEQGKGVIAFGVHKFYR